MRINLPEAGYTPANLRRLMSDYQLTNRQVAGMLGKHENSVGAWRKDLSHAGHKDMPLIDWIRLLALTVETSNH